MLEGLFMLIIHVGGELGKEFMEILLLECHVRIGLAVKVNWINCEGISLKEKVGLYWFWTLNFQWYWEWRKCREALNDQMCRKAYEKGLGVQ